MTANSKAIMVLRTGNSAPSIRTEAHLNHSRGGRQRAARAGAKLTGRINPLAFAALAGGGISVDASTNSWNESASPDAPTLDSYSGCCRNAARY
jgi:arsenate reductase (thioredoxin)